MREESIISNAMREISKLATIRQPDLFALKLVRRLRRELLRPETWLDFYLLQDPRLGLPPFSERRILNLYLQPLLEAGPHVIYDIGANIGEHSVALSRVTHVSTIIAFEPDPNTYTKLLSNTTFTTKVRAHNYALSDSNTELTFFSNTESVFSSPLKLLDQGIAYFPGAHKYQPASVQAWRLDDLRTDRQLPQPNIVKIDVQGYEPWVLRGAEETVRAASWLLIELSIEQLYESSPKFNQQFHQIDDLGFDLVDVLEFYKGNQNRTLQLTCLFRRKTRT